MLMVSTAKSSRKNCCNFKVQLLGPCLARKLFPSFLHFNSDLEFKFLVTRLHWTTLPLNTWLPVPLLVNVLDAYRSPWELLKILSFLGTKQAEVRPMVFTQFCHKITFLSFQREHFPFHRYTVMAQQQRNIFLGTSRREYNSAGF